MKMENVKRVVGRHGISGEKQFSIAATPKAFKALSKTIYPDAVLAVIRELSCNAKDSHVDAGKADVPFEIHLPNSLEPWFAVTDFGIGLSDDDLYNLFTTYFESTKGDSNEVTGCFGIGSKSPFAYVDDFIVESRWNGTMTIYSCFYDEDEVPTLGVMAEPFPTDLPNGLTIKMAVKDQDMRNFAQKAASSLRRFDPAPIVTGNTDYEIKTIEYDAEGTNWKMLKDANPYGNSKIHAIQGNVTYPVDEYSLTDLTDAQSAVMELSADIFFNIGDIDVVLSREGLEYTEKTIKNIKAALDVMVEELPPLFQSKFDACKTLWEARILFQDVVKGLPHGLRNLLANKDIGLKWHTQPLNESFVLPSDDFAATIIQFQRGYRGNRGQVLAPSYGSSGEYKFNADTNILFFYDDVGHGAHSRLTCFMEGVDSSIKYAYLIKTDAKKALRKYSKALGKVKLQPVSNLPKRPRAAISARRVTSKVLEYVGRAHDRRDSWSPTELDLKTGGVYVMINRFKIHDGGYEVSDFDGIVELAKANNIIDLDGEPIYGIRKGDIEKIKDGSGWVDLFDLIRTNITEVVEAEQVASVLSDYRAFGEFGFSMSRYTDDLLKVGFDLTTAMGKFLEAHVYMSERRSDRASAIASMAGKVRHSHAITNTTPEHDLDALWNAVTAQYPLIELIDSQKMRGGYYSEDGVGEKNFAYLMDYIAAMDLVGETADDDAEAEEDVAA